MSASHPTFNRGHCFMTTWLNRQEVEYLGPILVERLERLQGVFDPDRAQPRPFGMSHNELKEHARQEIKRLEDILTKIDYPFRSTT